MTWLYPVILAVRIKNDHTGDIECLCVVRRFGEEFCLYTADLSEPTTEIDIGLDSVLFTDADDELINQYLIESFWRLEIEQAEIEVGMYQQPISGLNRSDLIDPALIDLLDLKLVAYNLSQRLDRLITGGISVDDALQSIARTLAALESFPNLSPETQQYLLSLKQKFITTSIVSRRTPRK